MKSESKIVLCKVAGCPYEKHGLGYCNRHYGSLRRHGDLVLRKPVERHGRVGTTEYNIWSGIKYRCLKVGSKSYHHYGGRGIEVCDDWLDFKKFYRDMGPRPEGMTLDRIDNDGNYEPSNCRWASKTIQSRNRRIGKDNTSGVMGVTWDKSRKLWLAYIRANKKLVSLGSFVNKDDAIKARQEAQILYWGDSKLITKEKAFK